MSVRDEYLDSLSATSVGVARCEIIGAKVTVRIETTTREQRLRQEAQAREIAYAATKKRLLAIYKDVMELEGNGFMVRTQGGKYVALDAEGRPK